MLVGTVLCWFAPISVSGLLDMDNDKSTKGKPIFPFGEEGYRHEHEAK